jgi:uncharacterized protein (TIGR01244 family)
MTPRRRLPVFWTSVLVGAAVVAGLFGWSHWQRQISLPDRPLAPGIGVSQQLQPKAMRVVADRAYTTVIDMRPDGEAPDEPGSAQMAAAARAQHLQFAYVPVPHGDIPDSVADSLARALASRPGPVLLYCRSGRRAARSWSLVEASRPGGMSVDEILAAARASGQDASDLRHRLEQRVRARHALAS